MEDPTKIGSMGVEYREMGVDKAEYSTTEVYNIEDPTDFANIPDDNRPKGEFIDCGPVVRTCRFLKLNEIPHILWGWWAITSPKRRVLDPARVSRRAIPRYVPRSLQTNTSFSQPIEIIVPDNYFLLAISALFNAGYHRQRLPEPLSPIERISDSYYSLFYKMPAHCFADSDEAYWGSVILYKQSHLLWRVSEELPCGAPTTSDSIFQAADIFPTTLTQEELDATLAPSDFDVSILPPATHAHALIFLFCRDFYPTTDPADPDTLSYWCEMMAELAAGDKENSIEGCLQPRLQPFWSAFWTDGQGDFNVARSLREELLEGQELTYVPWRPQNHGYNIPWYYAN